MIPSPPSLSLYMYMYMYISHGPLTITLLTESYSNLLIN